MTAPSTTTDVDMQEFAQTLGQEIATAFQSASVGRPGRWAPSRSAPTIEPADAEVQERFLPLLGAVLPAVASAVPSIINSIRGGSRALPAAPKDPEQAKEEFQAVLGELIPTICECVPDILATIDEEAGDGSPDDPETTTRFFGALMDVLGGPLTTQCFPGVVSALTGGRRDIEAEVYDDPELTTRFLGSILGPVVGGLGNALGGLLGGGGGGGGGRPQRPQRPRPQRPQRPRPQRLQRPQRIQAGRR